MAHESETSIKLMFSVPFADEIHTCSKSHKIQVERNSLYILCIWSRLSGMISLGMTCESCCILRVTQPPVSVYALFQLEVLFPEQQWQLGETMGVEGEPPTEGEVQEVRAILAKKVEDIQSEELDQAFLARIATEPDYLARFWKHVFANPGPQEEETAIMIVNTARYQ